MINKSIDFSIFTCIDMLECHHSIIAWLPAPAPDTAPPQPSPECLLGPLSTDIATFCALGTRGRSDGYALNKTPEDII